jgi:hypothetical protein
MSGITETTIIAAPAKVGTVPTLPPAVGLASRLRHAWLWPLAFGLALAALSETYLLVQFWPATVSPGATATDATNVVILGQKLEAVPRETQFFVVVILGGALGGTVHSLRSLAWYVGSQRLSRSWALRYCYLPLIGSLLALALYIIVRAGFLAGTSVDASSPFGFVALGMLAGLFSDQGITKLKTVFEVLLAEAEKGPEAG